MAFPRSALALQIFLQALQKFLQALRKNVLSDGNDF